MTAAADLALSLLSVDPVFQHSSTFLIVLPSMTAMPALISSLKSLVVSVDCGQKIVSRTRSQIVNK